MHIVIDARIVNSTTGRYVERLLTHLQDIDVTNRYTILVPEKDKNYWKPKNDNFTVVVADFKNYSFAEQTGFYFLLRKLKPDLVHFCMPQQPILYGGKKVTTIHDVTLVKTYNSDKNWFIYHFKQFIGGYVFKHISKTNDHLIAISQFTKKEYMDYTHVPEEKISVIYEASEVGLVAPQPYKTKYKQYILAVGHQADYKNIKRLGDAYQKLLETYPNLGLILAGKKTAPALNNEAYFKKKGYKNIVFTDFVSDGQLSWLYTHATAYIFPSLMEGFGLPGLEAMEHGTPVIASNATSLPEIYGDAARYFDPTSTDDIARVITEVIGNEKLRTTMSQKGYQQIKKYSWRKMAEQTHAIYMKVLKIKN